MADRRPDAFTLVELLVVIAIVALLLGVLAPALGKARLAAKRTACLANMRGLTVAHTAYMAEFGGRMIDASHAGSEDRSWVLTLRDGYGSEVKARSPVDTSPHFARADGGRGVPVPGTTGVYRRTSYAINDYLAPYKQTGYDRLGRVPRPSSTIHFVIAVFEGKRAAADHVHADGWYTPHTDFIPLKASREMQLDAHGGEPASWRGRGNYGYLDGHAESRLFEQTYRSFGFNQYNPAGAD